MARDDRSVDATSEERLPIAYASADAPGASVTPNDPSLPLPETQSEESGQGVQTTQQ